MTRIQKQTNIERVKWSDKEMNLIWMTNTREGKSFASIKEKRGTINDQTVGWSDDSAGAWRGALILNEKLREKLSGKT